MIDYLGFVQCILNSKLIFIHFDNKWKKHLKYLVFLSKCICCIFAHFQFQGYHSCNCFASASVLCPSSPILCHISDCDLIIFILYHVFVYQYILCVWIGHFSWNCKTVISLWRTLHICNCRSLQLIIPPQSLFIKYVYHKWELWLVRRK